MAVALDDKYALPVNAFPLRINGSLSFRFMVDNVEKNCENMMPNIFMQCHPITNFEDLEDVIKDPPNWVDKVIPIAHRSRTVLQNIISDCHSDAKHFLVRNRFDERTVPKTLVCHDYKGGYHADKYVSE